MCRYYCDLCKCGVMVYMCSVVLWCTCVVYMCSVYMCSAHVLGCTCAGVVLCRCGELHIPSHPVV